MIAFAIDNVQKKYGPPYLNEGLCVLLVDTIESLGEQSGCKWRIMFKALELEVLVENANKKYKHVDSTNMYEYKYIHKRSHLPSI